MNAREIKRYYIMKDVNVKEFSQMEPIVGIYQCVFAFFANILIYTYILTISNICIYIIIFNNYTSKIKPR